MASELRAEIDSADRVDLLCAFVKWYGLRVLEKQLDSRAERGVPMRVITTTYMGATERRALDRLVRTSAPRCEIQYDARRTRLHAKAWLFRRRTGFDTAYVGSSNLTPRRAARRRRVERPPRACRHPRAARQVRRHVRLLLEQPTSSSLRPRRRPRPPRRGARWSAKWHRPIGPRSRSRSPAWRCARTRTSRRCSTPSRSSASSTTVTATSSSLRPAPARPSSPRSTTAPARAATALAALRRAPQGDPRAVAAYLPRGAGRRRPSVSCTSAGRRPERWQHVFASVQSLHSYGVAQHPRRRVRRRRHRRVPPRRGARPTAASSTTSQPTRAARPHRHPERADGVDVRDCFDGRIAAELRLWDALECRPAVPVPLLRRRPTGRTCAAIDWREGDYDDPALTNVYTGNDARVRIVLARASGQDRRRRRMRALGLLRLRRARRVHGAASSTTRGVPAVAVTGDTPRTNGPQALADLRDREVNVLFAVDLFNEGLDVPDVDTVLLPSSDRERDGLPAAARSRPSPHARTRPCSPSSTSSVTSARSSDFDRRLPRAHRSARARTSRRAVEGGLPLPALRAAQNWCSTAVRSRSSSRTSSRSSAQPLDSASSRSSGASATSI